MADFRILVTGSRDWDDEATLALHLGMASGETPDWRDVVVVHGACPKGADKIADTLARSHKVRREPHPADWDTYGRAAGFRRNAEMVALGANVCLAFIMPCTDAKCRRPGPHGSHGASHCARLADTNGIETRRFGIVGEFDG